MGFFLVVVKSVLSACYRQVLVLDAKEVTLCVSINSCLWEPYDICSW